MYEMIAAIAMGILQGVTEFLPVSSSGHLVIAGGLLNIEEPGVLWTAVLHLATTVAIIFALRREVFNLTRALGRGTGEYLRSFDIGRALEADPLFRMSLLVLAASIPICVVGYLLERRIDKLFDSPLLAGTALLVTGAIVWVSKLKRNTTDGDSVRTRGALEMGLAQVFAIVPGISRSGTTISYGMLRGMKSDEAARFSFLIAIIPLMSAGFLKLYRQYNGAANPVGPGVSWPLLLAAVAAGISGYIAILFLLKIVRKGKLHYFAWYCWAVGLLTIIWQVAST